MTGFFATLETSSGDVLRFDDEDAFVAALDHYGPEVVSSAAAEIELDEPTSLSVGVELDDPVTYNRPTSEADSHHEADPGGWMRVRNVYPRRRRWLPSLDGIEDSIYAS